MDDEPLGGGACTLPGAMRTTMRAGRAFFVSVVFLCACGGTTSTGSTDDSGTSKKSDSDVTGDSSSAYDSGASGDSPTTTDVGGKDTNVPPDAYGGWPTPIRHVVVIVKENHTFDNYFGSFPGAEGISKITLKDGTTFAPPSAPDRTGRDMCHLHSCALTDWNGGKMDGWPDVAGSDSGGDHLAWAQYDEKSIPNYWAYAKAFTLGDHFFASELGPSWPGHMTVLAAQAHWSLDNPGTTYTHPFWGCDQSSGTTVDVLDNGTCTVKSVFPCFKIPSVPDVLPSGIDWKFYGSNFYLFPEIWSMFNGIDPIRNGPSWAKVVNASQFDSDVDAKKLPNVVWLVNQDLNDEHPNIGGICAGENWTVDRINKIMGSDYWKDTAIIFTMDDFGGWYDHVPPPRQYGCDSAHPYGLGFRLPLLVISPYAKPHTIFKEVADQASIPKFIETVMGSTKTLHSLDPAAQDDVANDLMNAFDFTQAPNSPLTLKTRACF